MSLFKPRKFTYCLLQAHGRRVYRTSDGRRVTKKTPGAVKVDLGRSKVWYGKVKGPDGKFRPVKLCTDKTASKQMLAKLVTDARMEQLGMGDRYAEHRGRPLREHLADWETALRAGGATDKHVAQTVAAVRRILDGCRFALVADLSASRVQTFLAELRQDHSPTVALDPGKELYRKAELAALLRVKPPAVPPLVRRYRLEATGKGKARRYPRATAEALLALRGRGKSIKTSNLYLAGIKQFCRWLVRDKRMPDNPLAHLEGGNVLLDRRHDRRELAEEELRGLLSGTRVSERTFRGLSGRDRYHLYATACGTGFRAGALASLTPESFDLEADPPTVTLAARRNKSRVLKVQPLPPDLTALLREYLRDRPAGQPVWPGQWADNAAEMLQADLKAVGIPYAIEGPDGPLFADFHALRHTYLTMGGRAGIDLRTLQELAGHSTPLLTARYSHRRLYDLAGAVEKLPGFLPGPTDRPETETLPLSATGTDGRDLARRRPRLDQNAAGGCDSVTTHENPAIGGAADDGCRNPLPLREVTSDCEGMREDEKSSPSETLLEPECAHRARESRERAAEGVVQQAVAA
jgi:integrase